MDFSAGWTSLPPSLNPQYVKTCVNKNVLYTIQLILWTDNFIFFLKLVSKRSWQHRWGNRHKLFQRTNISQDKVFHGYSWGRRTTEAAKSWKCGFDGNWGIWKTINVKRSLLLLINVMVAIIWCYPLFYIHCDLIFINKETKENTKLYHGHIWPEKPHLNNYYNFTFCLLSSEIGQWLPLEWYILQHYKHALKK